MVAEDVILAQRRVQLAKQLAEGVQLLRLGELVENIAGQHKQVGTARLDFCFQLRDAGVIHRRTGARVDITDLHDGQPAVRQIFRVVRLYFVVQSRSARRRPHHMIRPVNSHGVMPSSQIICQTVSGVPPMRRSASPMAVPMQ